MPGSPFLPRVALETSQGCRGGPARRTTFAKDRCFFGGIRTSRRIHSQAGSWGRKTNPQRDQQPERLQDPLAHPSFVLASSRASWLTLPAPEGPEGLHPVTSHELPRWHSEGRPAQEARGARRRATGSPEVSWDWTALHTHTQHNGPRYAPHLCLTTDT